MKALIPAAWFVGVILFIWFACWTASRLIRWAKRGTKSGSLIGWSLGLPAAGVNPIPPPQEQIEEVTRDVQGRKNSDSAAPDE